MKACLILALLFGVLFQAVPKQKNNPQTNQDDSKHLAEQSQKPARGGTEGAENVGPSSGPSSQEKQDGANSEPKRVSWCEKIFEPVWANWPLILVAIWGIWVARGTLKIIERQTKTTEDNVEAFVHSQRPWISVRTALASPLTYDENGAQITLKIEVKNVGQMPAMGVFIFPAIYIDSVPGKLSPPAERARMCEQMRKIRQIGQAIFPGEPAVYHMAISAPVSDVEAGCATIFKDKAAEARMFGAKIIVVVGYGTALDKDASYHTAAIYDLHRREPGRGDEPFSLKMETTPLERLQLNLAIVSAIIAE